MWQHVFVPNPIHFPAVPNRPCPSHEPGTPGGAPTPLLRRLRAEQPAAGQRRRRLEGLRRQRDRRSRASSDIHDSDYQSARRRQSGRHRRLLPRGSGRHSTASRPPRPSDAYLIFGRPGGFPAELDLQSLDGTNGYVIDGRRGGRRGRIHGRRRRRHQPRRHPGPGHRGERADPFRRPRRAAARRSSLYGGGPPPGRARPRRRRHGWPDRPLVARRDARVRDQRGRGAGVSRGRIGRVGSAGRATSTAITWTTWSSGPTATGPATVRPTWSSAATPPRATSSRRPSNSRRWTAPTGSSSRAWSRSDRLGIVASAGPATSTATGSGTSSSGLYAADAPGRTSAGQAYVIFGRTSFPASFDLASLNGSNGFTVNGSAANDYLGVLGGRGRRRQRRRRRRRR